MISKKENILIYISGIIFLTLFGICSYFNRFAVDDYFHIYNETKFGIWGEMIEGYNNWGGRWTSYLLWNIIYHFHDSKLILFIYTFSIILFFILAVYLLFKQLFLFTASNITRQTTLITTILFSSFTFLFSFNKGEIWFWTVSTAMYIVSIIFFIFLLSLLISKSRKIYILFLIIIFSVFAGGTSEIYALFYILFLLLFIFVLFFSKNPILGSIRKPLLLKLAFAIFFITTAFIISVKAPGNEVRASWLPEPSFLKSIFITFKELVKIIVLKFSIQLHWVVLFSIPFIYLGFINGINLKKIDKKKTIKPFFISILVLFILLYILLFPSCYILSEAGPDRSLSMIIITVAIFIASWFYYIGKNCIKNNLFIKKLFFTSMAIIIFFLSTLCIMQFRIDSKYASTVDIRESFLKDIQKNKNKKTITITKLPPSGFLYSAEISADTNYFGNEHYRLGLFLDFKVSISKDK